MDDRTDRLAAALRRALLEEFDRSPAVRELAVELARWVLDEAQRFDGERQAAEYSEQSESEPVKRRSAPEVAAIVPLRLGGVEVRVQVNGTAQDLRAAHDAFASEPGPDGLDRDRDDMREINLSLIAERARLKAASCRFFIERRAAEGDESRKRPLIEKMNEMIAKAKAMPECFLWVFWRHETQPDDEVLGTIARCYDALAEGASLCMVVADPNTHVTAAEIDVAFQHLAEASSALRIALDSTWLRSIDRDQDDAHLWLRQETFTRQVFVKRYMTLDDSADPGRAGELLKEVRARAVVIENRERESKRIESLFNRARYHSRQLPHAGADPQHDCTRINESLEELERLGVSATDPRCDELRLMTPLSPFPADAPPHPFLLPTTPTPAESEPMTEEQEQPQWSDRVLEVRDMLSGGAIVIVGGEPRPDAAARIRKAFGSSDVRWVELSEHGTGEPMRAPIARPDTRLVLVLVKLCGHLHSEEARRCAKDANVPCVMLPAGYNPEQIAERALAQAAERLA